MSEVFIIGKDDVSIFTNSNDFSNTHILINQDNLSPINGIVTKIHLGRITGATGDLVGVYIFTAYKLNNTFTVRDYNYLDDLPAFEATSSHDVNIDVKEDDYIGIMATSGFLCLEIDKSSLRYINLEDMPFSDLTFTSSNFSPCIQGIITPPPSTLKTYNTIPIENLVSWNTSEISKWNKIEV